MPLYEYECISGHRFEEIQKFADDPVECCPVCGSEASRLMSTSSFSLKGEGWYRDGYTKKTGAKKVAKQTRDALVKRDTGD